MVKHNIETAWVDINNRTKTPVYGDWDKGILYYGTDSEDARHYVATCDYLHMPEISSTNEITFTKPVAWDDVTDEDINIIARALNVKTGIVDLRPYYAAETAGYIYNFEP